MTTSAAAGYRIWHDELNAYEPEPVRIRPSRAAFLASGSDMAQARYLATVELERYRKDRTVTVTGKPGETIVTGTLTVEFKHGDDLRSLMR